MNKKFKILVVGELFQDFYSFFDALRLCPEGPVPVLRPVKEEFNHGGAGNVVCNIKSLSPESEVHFIHQKSIITKTRYVDNATGHLFLRVDTNDKVPDNERLTQQKIVDYLFIHKLSWADLDAVVISDYGKGFISEEVIQFLAQSHPLTFLDTKLILGEFSKDIKIVKVNKKEYDFNLTKINNPEDFCGQLIVTRGMDATLLFNKNSVTNIPLPFVHLSANTSGCGDSFSSCFILKYLETKDIREAIDYANKGAGICASKPGVYTLRPEDFANA